MEAQAEPGGNAAGRFRPLSPRFLRELDAPHLPESVRRDHPGQVPAGQEREEAAQVAHRGHERPGRRHPQREGRRRELAPVVTPHGGARQPLGRGGGEVEGTGVETQRGQRRFGDGVGEGFPGGDFEDPAHDRDSGVRVLQAGAGREDERDPVQTRDGLPERGRGVVEVVADRRFPHQPGAVRHQLPQRDRVGGVLRPGAGSETGQRVADRGVEVQRAALVEGDDGEVGEEFGDRTDPEQRVRIGGDPRTGFAETLRPDDPVAVRQRQRQSGDLLGFHLVRDEVAQVGGEVGVFRGGADPRRRRRAGPAAVGEEGGEEGRGERERPGGEAGKGDYLRPPVAAPPPPPSRRAGVLGDPGESAHRSAAPAGLLARTPAANSAAAEGHIGRRGRIGRAGRAQRSGAAVQCGSSSESGAGPSSSRPGARLPRASSKKSATRFQKRPRGG